MPARKIINYEGGSDARYDTSQMRDAGNGRLTDGSYEYDSEGRPWSLIPGGQDWTDGLMGARGGTSPYDLGGGGGGGGAGLSSPFFQQAKSATEAASAADSAARKQAIQQMLVQFGLVPEGVKDPYGDIDDTTRSLATANTASGISVSARLKQALADAQRTSGRNLAARGLRRSGTRGYQMRRNQLGYDQNYSDAISKLLGGLNQTYQGFAQGEYGRAMSLAQALQSALSQWTPRSYSPPSPPSTPSPQPTTSSSPATTPTYSAPYGQIGYGKPLPGFEG